MIIIADIINSVHHFFLSQMLGVCSSYQYMVGIMWICLCLMCYLVLLVLLRIYTTSYVKKCDELDKLCSAIEQNEIVTCVRLLEEYPEYINKFTKHGYTPFLIACTTGNTQLVKIMLKKGADVQLKSIKSESPFYLATFYYIKFPKLKNATCIRELYYAGADINATNDKGLTPLQMAAMFGHTALVKWLLLKNASTDTVPDPYIIASSQGHQETASVILKTRTCLPIDCK